MTVRYERTDNRIVCSEGWWVDVHGRGGFIYADADAKLIVGGELLREQTGAYYAAIFPDEINAFDGHEPVTLPTARQREIAERIIRAYGHFGEKVVGPTA